MSLHRVNPRRDENEPEVRKRFAHHGWHTEQVSGKGMPDLLVWPNTVRESNYQCLTASALVDVKMPKGKLKPAQEEKWKALHEKCIPVYVVRTAADVDALVGGTLEPWRPAEPVDGLRDIARPAHYRAMKAAQEAEETFAPGPMGEDWEPKP